MYRAAANDVISGGIARVSAGAALSVGGELATMPVAVRFAANASRFAVEGLFASPVGLAVGAAAWLATECISYQNGQWVVTCGAGVPTYPVSTGTSYSFSSPAVPGSFTTQGAACSALISFLGPGGAGASYTLNGVFCNISGAVTPSYNGNYSTNPRADSCTPGWYETPGGCVQNPPPVVISEPDAETRMAPHAIPDDLPQQLPFPLPVEQPILNPDAETDPQPQPLWVPQGNPVPVPNTNPQQYSQPGTRITPQPTPSSPWQVDVAPDDKISTSPTPITSPQAVPPADAASAPSSTQPPDICQLHPNIVACQTLGDLDPVSIPNQNVPLSITPDSGWSTGLGACPAPQTFTVLGYSYSLSWSAYCTFASGIRPVIIGLAWLSAAFIFFGFVKE